jgi:hypothetical protein
VTTLDWWRSRRDRLWIKLGLRRRLNKLRLRDGSGDNGCPVSTVTMMGWRGHLKMTYTISFTFSMAMALWSG